MTPVRTPACNITFQVKSALVEARQIGPVITTFWSPTEYEMARMMEGEPVKIAVVAATLPPLRVGVGAE